MRRIDVKVELFVQHRANIFQPKNVKAAIDKTPIHQFETVVKLVSLEEVVPENLNP